MFKITKDYANEMKRGALLARPAPGTQDYKVKGLGDTAKHVWREVAKIEDIELTEEAPGKEMLRVQFRVPADVVSKNQGRSFSEFFRFNWADAQAGDGKAQTGCSINYRNLCALLAAAGYDGELEFLNQIPKTIVGQRVSIQVREETSEDYGPQNRFGGYKAA